MDDIEQIGLDKAAEIALELAWKDADAVYISFDVDSIDCGFVPGTGWPEPGGFLPREACSCWVGRSGGICGMEVVEVSPPYDISDITALMGVRWWSRCWDRWSPTASSARTSRSSTNRLHIRGEPHARGPRTRTSSRQRRVSGAQSRAPPHAAQWQTPHLPHDRDRDDHHHHEADLDMVEKVFVESFTTSTDPTSFLRLARVPFEAIDRAGRRLQLLRVETEFNYHVGSVTPHLGGSSMRFDPLPASMVSQRRRLRFVYFDGGAARLLRLGEVRELAGA